MSQEHIQGLREGYELSNLKDFDAVLAMVHPNFVYENDPAGPLGATVYCGRADVKGFWEDFHDVFDDFRHEPYEFLEAAGGKYLVRVRLAAYLEGTEEPLRFEYTHVWTIRDDLPVHCRLYFNHGEALEAAGMREPGEGRTRLLTRGGFRGFPSSVAEKARRAGRRWSRVAQRPSRRH
jgi:ketosteroid isomerase-like protein